MRLRQQSVVEPEHEFIVRLPSRVEQASESQNRLLGVCTLMSCETTDRLEPRAEQEIHRLHKKDGRLWEGPNGPAPRRPMKQARCL